MFRRVLSYFLLSFLTCFGLSAQNHEDTDSLVRLLSCDELRQEEEFGKNLRKALGHARFQHNGTLLLCDTALWHVEDQIINATGHVQIIQNETILTSEKLDYYIQDNLAQFRGVLVQLQDKKKNTLRTNNLDYDTRDSIAIFRDGGSFRDESGQIIEGDVGTYDSKIKTFFFNGNVNMFTDSIFIKTDHLEYNTDQNFATFGKGTNAWQKKNMLSADAGWYDRAKEIFFFNDNVHLLTENQEGWADSLKYFRNTKDAEMFGNAQVLDTTRKVASVAGYMHYCDSLSKILMRRDPAVICVVEQDSTRDTVYVGGDELVYWTVPKCAIPDENFKSAKARVDEMYQDAIGAYRKKASKDAAAKAAEEKKKMEEDDPNAYASVDRGRGAVGLPTGATGQPAGGIKPPAAGESPQQNAEHNINQDSLKIATIRDSLARADSIALAKTDSTAIGFARAVKNVKLYKSDMQMVCDSLEYSDLDSLVRLYLAPLVWNEEKRQYSADSIAILIKNRSFDRASLMSQAFIAIQEDSACYDQIKSTDMMAYFDTSGALKRFDAMGSVAGVFYIEENKSLATVNKFESKMLTANFKDGSINDLNYFEAVKSDAYPVVQMKMDERFLKDYKWLPDKRPKSPSDVTSLIPRKSMRTKYESIPHAAFPNTDKYFPGYMKEVNKMLARSDSLKRVRNLQKDSLDRIEAAREDSLALIHEAYLDSLSKALALGKDTLAVKDSLAANPDSLSMKADTLSGKENQLVSKSDSLAGGVAENSIKQGAVKDGSGGVNEAKQEPGKESIKEAKQAKRLDREARKKARWERLEKEDQEKAAKKAAKQQEKLRKKTLKTLRALDKRAAKEQKIYDRYKARYEKQKAREDARKSAIDLKQEDTQSNPDENTGTTVAPPHGTPVKNTD
ncbi:MAG: OstA-like protein [Bacteroidales bacterium]|nr:OstA-like protein [Bacteroidales bacterium]MDY6001011.1 OstA-like protein [Candidatus Cryptobacteroides sp.]